jgi:hypothetical protein
MLLTAVMLGFLGGSGAASASSSMRDDNGGRAQPASTEGSGAEAVCAGASCAPLTQAAFVFEGELADYVPGAKGAGLLIGGRTAGGVTLGVTFGIGTRSLSLAGSERVKEVWGYGAAFRARVFGTDDHKVTLEVGADVRIARNVPSGIQNPAAPSAVVTGSGFVVGGGPTVAYWVHPRLALGYSPRLTVLSTSDSNGGLTRTSLMNVVRVMLAF